MKKVVKKAEMTENEIQETIRAFGDVTKRAIKAGFDGIELHGAHDSSTEFLLPSI